MTVILERAVEESTEGALPSPKRLEGERGVAPKEETRAPETATLGWAGSLKGLAPGLSSVDLQHRISDLRGTPT